MGGLLVDKADWLVVLKGWQTRSEGFVANFMEERYLKPIARFPELAFEVSNGITLCSDYHLKSGLHKELLI